MASTLDLEDSIQPFLDPMLWRQLKGVLCYLQHKHYPHVPNPPSCTKRASVALIVRFRPSIVHQANFDASQCGVSAGPATHRLERFFAQPWVQAGEPEILFIKRASRAGDRWTGHVAFPGGGREPADADDAAASIRETQEETGIDLSADHCILVGNLPEQVVTTWWSKVPLMVLCPFVHLVLRFDLPPMKLQPTEVKSAHWVSLRALMSPYLRTFERQDVSERFLDRGNTMTRWIVRSMIGQLLFTARILVPTESYHSRSTSEFIPQAVSSRISSSILTWQILKIKRWAQKGITPDPPLILWGLTYGILANFLGLMPTDDPTVMWDWPTLSPWDIRFAVWAFNHHFRSQRMESLAQIRDIRVGENHPQTEMNGLDTETFIASGAYQEQKRTSMDTVNGMLDGYFDRLRKAMWTALAVRFGIGTLIAGLVIRQWHKRRLSRW